jgi:hypothetical protein
MLGLITFLAACQSGGTTGSRAEITDPNAAFSQGGAPLDVVIWHVFSFTFRDIVSFDSVFDLSSVALTFQVREACGRWCFADVLNFPYGT